MPRKNAIAAAIETDGSTATAEGPGRRPGLLTEAKRSRQEIPKRIRKAIKELPIVAESAIPELQKEILTFINGLLKQINDNA